ELRRACDEGREVADARNEIPEEQCPVTGSGEPVVHTVDVFVADVQPAAVAVDGAEAERAADQITEGDAAGTAGKCGGDGPDGMEPALINQITGEDQQPFVGYGQSHDAQHQQPENSAISIGRDPLEDRVQV